MNLTGLVQRATVWPLAVELGPHLRRPIHPEVLGMDPHDLFSARSERAEGALRLAGQYVDGANCSTLQIGSTPKRPRWASM